MVPVQVRVVLVEWLLLRAEHNQPGPPRPRPRLPFTQLSLQSDNLPSRDSRTLSSLFPNVTTIITSNMAYHSTNCCSSSTERPSKLGAAVAAAAADFPLNEVSLSPRQAPQQPTTQLFRHLPRVNLIHLRSPAPPLQVFLPLG